MAQVHDVVAMLNERGFAARSWISGFVLLPAKPNTQQSWDVVARLQKNRTIEQIADEIVKCSIEPHRL